MEGIEFEIDLWNMIPNLFRGAQHPGDPISKVNPHRALELLYGSFPYENKKPLTEWTKELREIRPVADRFPIRKYLEAWWLPQHHPLRTIACMAYGGQEQASPMLHILAIRRYQVINGKRHLLQTVTGIHLEPVSRV